MQRLRPRDWCNLQQKGLLLVEASAGSAVPIWPAPQVKGFLSLFLTLRLAKLFVNNIIKPHFIAKTLKIFLTSSSFVISSRFVGH